MKQLVTMPDLEGKWHIIATNFPIWLKGNKLNPTLNYTLVNYNDARVLLDEVVYTQAGKTKTITGYDHPDELRVNAYKWRGKGLLSLLTSKWEIKLIDPNKQWAVSWFSKTPFTPEGVEIISRKPALDATEIEQIKQAMHTEPVLKKYVDMLKPLPVK